MVMSNQLKSVTTITCDHRVIDGTLAAEFMNALKDYLETPAKLIV